MTFKIALTPSYKTKVVVETPNEHGKVDKSDFMAEFKRFGLAELDELRKKPQKEVLEEALIGWSGLVDESGQEVAYNPVNRGILLNIPQAFAALLEAFWSSIFKAREKN